LTAELILYVFIFLVAFNYIFNSVLEFLNTKNWKNNIPENLKDFYSKDKYLQARDYKIHKGKIGLISSSISFLITISFLIFNGYGMLNEYISSDDVLSNFQSQYFFTALFLLNFFIGIPISYYSNFVIEEKFGFNKMDIKTFVLDKLKSFIISIILIFALTSLAVFIIDYFSSGFWLWLWISLSTLMILLNMFYADLIVPIFNKLTPLESGDLRSKIEKYSSEIGYSLKNIFIIDGSKRSTKANAFFSGIGPRKTIALFDTLVDNYTDEELISVLAHEVGHYKKNHILISMFLTISQLALICFVFELCLGQDLIANALGSSSMNFHLGIIGFSLLYSPLSLVTGIFMNMLSRKNEFEADDYAKNTSSGSALQSALKKLSADSLSNLYPHPLYVFVHYSHPPLLKRLNALNKKPH
tara:strand:+ start:1342 stop:2583 length:1242 start_codon:yes stop_codon:yes gene_type:complete